MKKYIKPKKYIWVDLEMTGLNPDDSRIIEVAAIITDVDFNELETLELVVHQPKEFIDASDDWVKDNMRTILDKSLDSDITEQQAEVELVKLVEKHFDEHAVLAGNSIHQDRRFIRKYWPSLETKLHYRMLDVSAWKVYMVAKYDFEFKKANEHRALADIRGSIQELKDYLEFFAGKD